MEFFRMGIVQVGVILGGDCPGGSYPEWGFCLVGVFQVGIVRGNHLGCTFWGGSFPSIDRRKALSLRLSNLRHVASRI